MVSDKINYLDDFELFGEIVKEVGKNKHLYFDNHQFFSIF
jgi:hypothetical protein